MKNRVGSEHAVRSTEYLFSQILLKQLIMSRAYVCVGTEVLHWLLLINVYIRSLTPTCTNHANLHMMSSLESS